MVGGHLRPAAGEFDARGPRFGPGRVFRRVIGKKFEVGADGTRVVGGVFGVALSDGNIGSEVYGDSGAASRCLTRFSNYWSDSNHLTPRSIILSDNI